MPRPSSVLASPTAILGSALLLALAACNDAPTAPSVSQPASAPSGNVLSIGGLRRAHPQTPCTAPEYHQFDFWLGTASVTADGEFNGTNDVTSELDGCLV